MQLEHLRILNFRNYEEAEVSWCPGINVIHGQNAQGKSNLLEAVALLGGLRSLRGASLGDQVRFSHEVAHIEGRLMSLGIPKQVQIHLKSGSRSLNVDGSPVRRRLDYLDHARSICFTADDLRLVSGSPSQRRRFLDTAITSVTPDYGEVQRQYARAVAQKAAVLTGPRPGAALLDIWDTHLAGLGATRPRTTRPRPRLLRASRPRPGHPPPRTRVKLPHPVSSSHTRYRGG